MTLVLNLAVTDPVTAFLAVHDDPLAVLLDGIVPHDPRSRYSYLCVDPVDAVVLPGDQSPFPHLTRILQRRRRPTLRGLPPFQGGLAGWLSYDLNRHIERLPQATGAQPPLPATMLGVFDAVAAFDHQRGQAWVVGEDRAARRLFDRLRDIPPPTQIDWTTRAEVRPDLTRTDYEARIARIIAYIGAGDVFQVNLAQRFSAILPRALSAFELYRRLRVLAPAPFSAFLRYGGDCVASVSPERFLTLTPQGHVEARPIKGTRPRGRTAAEDQALAEALKNSEKDRAENLMILDLMRNDISRVCTIGSVQASQRMTLETFPAIHHLVSAVTGQLRPGLNAVDLVRACFPPGSITGAPKVRAMEIIAELEPTARGPYCGAFGWFGDDGAMDLAVAIRTVVMHGRQTEVHAGGAITWDSDPAEEYEETVVKAAPLLAALRGDRP